MILDEIVHRKRQEIRGLPPRDPAGLARSTRDFRQVLESSRRRIAIIAEIKRASPSAGRLTNDFDPRMIAKTYETAGARAISVLTDVEFFQGCLEHMTWVSETTAVPVLRKDFVIDERQIHEARAAGADSILLIAAILERRALAKFLSESRALGMEPLVEIHDEREMDLALEAGASIVGINNRDLKSFRIDMMTTLELAPRLPAGIVVVSESGVEGEAELSRLAGLVDAALIGTALMKSNDRAGLLARLVAAGRGNGGK